MCANVIKAYGNWEGVDGTTKINDLSSISFGKITVSFIVLFLFIQSKNLNKIQLNLFAPCSGKGHIVIWSLLQWCSQFNKI